MAQAERTSPASAAIDRRTFWLRRLHSLTGILPIGLYAVVHIFINSFAASGADVYNEVAEFLESLPYLILIEIPFIWAPILYHSLYGIYIHATGKPNPFRYTYANNEMYWLQRWSGIVTLVFIGWHFWQTRMANYLYDTPIDFDMMANIFADPKWVAFYVVGLVGVSFHLANGLRTFMLTWGLVVGTRARVVTAKVAAAFGALFLAASLAAIWAFVK